MTISVTGCSTCSRALTSRKKSVAARVRDELARPRAEVSHVLHHAQRRLVELASPRVALFAREERRRRRRLLDDLLVPPLHAALALAERVRRAVGVAEDLHLDVARLVDVPLEVDARVRERRLAAVRAALQGALEPVLGGHDLHADAAAAADGLDHDRIARSRERRSLAASSPSGVSIAMGSSVPGTGHVPAASATCLAFILSPNASSTAGGGPTKTAPASATARANAGFSLRKPYPGCTACAPVRRTASRIASRVQVRVLRRRRPDAAPPRRRPSRGAPRVGLGVHGHGADAETPARAHHAARDLAPVSDQDLGERLARGHRAFVRTSARRASARREERPPIDAETARREEGGLT